jgi:hypothetical protein
MRYTSEVEAENAYGAYSREAGCSRMNAAHFLDNGVPPEYVRFFMDSDIRRIHRILSSGDIIDLHKTGVDANYAYSCLLMGVDLRRVPKLWDSGIPLDYLEFVVKS